MPAHHLVLGELGEGFDPGLELGGQARLQPRARFGAEGELFRRKAQIH
jgi:hypothetical protein